MRACLDCLVLLLETLTDGVAFARTGEMGLAYVTGLQSGKRRNVSSTALGRMAATCKHFTAFGSPQGGLSVSFRAFL